MSTTQIFVMWLEILVGFACVVVAAAGYRRGWQRRTWIGWLVAAVVFLTVIPVTTALTLGLSSGVGGAPFGTADKTG